MKAALSSLLLLMFCSAQAEETDAVRAECQRIGNKLGSVSVQDCLDLNLYATTGRSVKGAPILQKEYAPIGGVEPMGKVLLFGGVHGDEYSSVSIVFKWNEDSRQTSLRSFSLARHATGESGWFVEKGIDAI